MGERPNSNVSNSFAKCPEEGKKEGKKGKEGRKGRKEGKLDVDACTNMCTCVCVCVCTCLLCTYT